MKFWEKPEMKNLCLSQTKSDGACQNMAEGASLFPDLGIYCTYWKAPLDRRCTHPNYGDITWTTWAWPCEKYVADGTDNDTQIS